MDEAVARFCAASQSNDIDGMIATLAPDAELVSPLSAHLVFRGNDDLRLLLGAVYGLLTDVRWDEQVGDGRVRVAISEARVSGVKIGDAMVFELDDEGRIRRIRPHLRPWLALTVFALVVAPRVARRPRAVLRALC
jgi:hypothetical protein